MVNPAVIGESEVTRLPEEFMTGVGVLMGRMLTEDRNESSFAGNPMRLGLN